MNVFNVEIFCYFTTLSTLQELKVINLLFFLFRCRSLVKNAKTNIRIVVWMLLIQRAIMISPFEKNARNLVDYAVQRKLFILIHLIIYMLF